MSLCLLEAMARQDSMADEAAWAAQLAHEPWSRTGVTNPDDGKKVFRFFLWNYFNIRILNKILPLCSQSSSAGKL